MTHKGRLTKLAGGTQAPANTLDVLLRLIKPEEMPDEPVFVAGLIYHIAFRVPTDQAVLRAGADGVTPVRDRSYFHSISYRGPGRNGFEIAIEDRASPSMSLCTRPAIRSNCRYGLNQTAARLSRVFPRSHFNPPKG